MKILTINLTLEKLEIQNNPVTIEKISNQKSCHKENAKMQPLLQLSSKDNLNFT